MPKPNVREQLLEAGLRTLHTQGFNGCAVQDITQAAGVPKGSFYNHFASKEAFGAEVVDVYFDSGLSELRALLTNEKVPPLERLRSYFTTRQIGRAHV